MTRIKVMIGTPSYDGRVGFSHEASTHDTAAEFRRRGIEWQPYLLGGCSIIEIARQDIVAQFMQSDCTHLLMIDSDIGWRGSDVVRMLEANEPLICAVAPKRLSDDFALCYREGEGPDRVEIDERGLIRAASVGGAFMLIRRDALLAMERAYPELEYRQGSDGLRKFAFFLLQLHGETGERRSLWGEDYAFCNRWRAIGGTVWVDPAVYLRHSHGSYHVEGCLASTIPALRDRDGEHLAQSIWSLPSRGRPDNMRRFIEAYRETGATCRVFVWIDSDDPARPEYEKIEYPEHWIVETGPRFEKKCNGVIEEMFRRFPDASCYGFLADDLVPRTKGWDARLALAARRDRLAYGDDLLQRDQLATHPVVGGDLARKIGWLILPTTRHLFADTALHTIAKGTGRLVYCPDVVMEHMHPIAGKAAKDETYQFMESFEADQAAFEEFAQKQLHEIAARINEFGAMNQPAGVCADGG